MDTTVSKVDVGSVPELLVPHSPVLRESQTFQWTSLVVDYLDDALEETLTSC